LCSVSNNSGGVVIIPSMQNISVRSNEREEMVEISAEVQAHLPDGGGVCVLFVQHTTCGLTINENADPDVKSDMLGWLKRLVPQFPPARSPETGADISQTGGESFFKHFEHNSDAHIKSSIVGSSVTVPFADGKLLLGRWQGIYLCEFDGPRERTVIVTVIGDK